MEGRYGLYSQGRSGWTSFRNEEFQEEDVWAVLNENTTPYKVGSSDSSSTTTPRRLSSTASRLIPRTNNNNKSMSQDRNKILQLSAPVNIPDWSKIYGKNSKKVSKSTAASWLDNDDDGGNGDEDGIIKSSWDSDGDYDDDEDGDDSDGNMMPPHEWLARKLARSQITSFSVCEGAGRTLKGRDLSRVRNAVLHGTGFLE